MFDKANSNNTMHIIMLSAQYMPEVFGGAEQQCQKLSKKLVENGLKVTVLTSRKSNKTKHNEILNGVNIVRLNAFGAPQLLSLRYFYSSVIWFVKVIAWLSKHKNEYDIIHAHQVKFNAFTGLVAASILKKRSIIKTGNSGQGFDLSTLKRKSVVGNFMYKYVIKHCDIAIAISTHIKEELLSVGIPNEKIVFIPNGVEVNINKPLTLVEKHAYRNELNLPVDKKIFLFVGRLQKQKDVLLLIESFAKAEPIQNNRMLVMVGDGELKNEVINSINKYNIQDAVILTGFKNNVQPYLLAADFLILSTKTEGLSNALLEGMSVGLIPVSTKVSGSTDLISPRYNGFLTEISSAQSLTDKIKEAGNLSEDETGLFNERCFEIIKTKYDINIVVQQYIQLYKTLH